MPAELDTIVLVGRCSSAAAEDALDRNRREIPKTPQTRIQRGQQVSFNSCKSPPPDHTCVTRQRAGFGQLACLCLLPFP